MKKSYIIIVVVLIIIAGYFVFKSKPEMKESEVSKNGTPMDAYPEGEDLSLSAVQSAQLKAGEEAHSPKTLTFDVNGGSFYFSPNSIKVKKGDTVKINFKNDGGMHDLKIDEYNVATKKLQSGDEDTISFVADKTGTFEYYCSVGQHRAMGMKGTLIVE